MLFAVRLAKAGYGTPEEILNMSVETVMAALEYETFVSEYQDEFNAMSKEPQ